MHQILRFLYVDQESGSTKIFRAEDNNRGDSEGIRIAIAEFLLGLDNLDTHKLRQQLILAEREFEKISSELNAMYKVLGTDSSLTVETLNTYIVKNSNEINVLLNKDVEFKEPPKEDRINTKKYKDLEKKLKYLIGSSNPFIWIYNQLVVKLLIANYLRSLLF
ncbi:hypothetical protein [Pseudoalteromonas sp. B160]|uniref:hypothetical protein n=1 Tax=Pseudoalteromonas sp. B160 TaxID=630414 RepID=UPI00301C0A8A